MKIKSGGGDGKIKSAGGWDTEDFLSNNNQFFMLNSSERENRGRGGGKEMRKTKPDSDRSTEFYKVVFTVFSEVSLLF